MIITIPVEELILNTEDFTITVKSYKGTIVKMIIPKGLSFKTEEDTNQYFPTEIETVEEVTLNVSEDAFRK